MQGHYISGMQTRKQRVREVEHATFTLLVMVATGGLANEANNFYKRLASMLADKWDYVLIQQHLVLATLPPCLLPPTLLHPGCQRCLVFVWTPH